MGFASLNGGQHVTLRLGVATFYGVPLTVVAFGGLVTGMVIMLAAALGVAYTLAPVQELIYPKD